MRASQLNWVLATENRRAVLVVVLWGVSIASVYAQALLRRSTLTVFDHAAVFAICLAGGAIMIDFGRALLGYMAASTIGMVLLFTLVTLPMSLGTIPYPGDITVTTLWISIIFKAVFPFPFVVYLVASFIGAGIGESYL